MKIIIVIVFWSLNFFMEIIPQYNTFFDIRENLLNENPQSGYLPIRYACFGSIDDLILGTYPPLHPDTKWFFTKMLEKAIIEIKTEQVTQGATIWQIYNHGFIVKTTSVIFGIDLHDYFRTEKFLELGDLIDAYFITHEHQDHFSYELIYKMQDQGKPVVGPAEFPTAPLKMNAGESRNIAGLSVTAHDGLHGPIPIRQYEIITPEGIKVLHTGDNQTWVTIPEISDVDILLLNCWVSEGEPTGWIEGVRNAIDKVKPQLTLPGHMMELGHLGQTYPPVPYRDPIESDNGTLASDYCILGWGEKYHYEQGDIDFVRPNIVENLKAEAYRDSILVTWDIAEAPDGDMANYYRVIIDHVPDTLLTENQLIHPIDELREYNFKVLSYDNWGNQSIDWAQIDFTASAAINYPPRIVNAFPLIKDSIHTFAGVISFFKIEAIDLNNDNLVYKWKLDDQEIDFYESTAAIDFFDLEAGQHKLSVIILDGLDSTIFNWNLQHYTEYAIVDNEDSVMYKDYGIWKTFTEQKAYGISCRTTGIGNLGDYAEYKFFPPKEGNYDLLQIIIKTTYASNNVLYRILEDGQKIDSVYIDQNHESGNWVKLGNFPFQQNSEITVQIINDGTATSGYSVVSDAIKFVYTSDLTALNNIEGKELSCFLMSQNYPNPFNPSTTIKYSIPSPVISNSSKASGEKSLGISPYGRNDKINVELKVFDILGREIVTLVNEEQVSGVYEVHFDGKGLNSGVYYCKLNVGNYMNVKKMILLK